ncbi:MAG TPA: LamG domain-containing protein [Dehalococcoidales bacterium]|nr:LamG domain-containing protein [Dehalococcoidales bacterium]
MQTLVDRDIDRLVFEPPEPGCVLYLPGLPGGGSKIYDRSPYGNIGAITGATWKKLPSGLWYLGFDGSDDYVDCGTAASLDMGTGDFSMLVWVYTSYPSDSNAGIISKKAGYFTNGYGLHTTSVAQAYWRILVHAEDSASNQVQYNNDSNLAIDAWYLVAVTFDRDGDATLYIKGDLEEIKSASMSSVGDIDNAHILEIGEANGRHHNGYIALPRIYRRVLSALEIQSYFDREKHLFGVW